MSFSSLHRLPVRALALCALSLAVAGTAAALPQPQPSKPAQPSKPGKMNPARPAKPMKPAQPGKPAKPGRTPLPTKPLPNPAKPPQPVAAAAEAVTPAVDVELTPAQHAAAGRVLVGHVACEFGQAVQLQPLPQQPGHFVLQLGKASYRLVPQETTTGAVRLEDAVGGVVWLQIPTKSMLLDARLGQRLVDNCQHADQRSVVVAAGRSLGIAEIPPLSDPWAGVPHADPVPDLAFAPLPLRAGVDCCGAEAAVPMGGG